MTFLMTRRVMLSESLELGGFHGFIESPSPHTPGKGFFIA